MPRQLCKVLKNIMLLDGYWKNSAETTAKAEISAIWVRHAFARNCIADGSTRAAAQKMEIAAHEKLAIKEISRRDDDGLFERVRPPR